MAVVINNRFSVLQLLRNVLFKFKIVKNQLGIITGPRKDVGMLQLYIIYSHVIQPFNWSTPEIEWTGGWGGVALTIIILWQKLVSAIIIKFTNPCGQLYLFFSGCPFVGTWTDGWMAPCGVLWHASSVSVNYQGPKLKLSNYCEYYYLRSPKTEGECHRVPKVGQTVCNRAIRHWPTRRRRMLCGALYVRVVNSRSVLR